MKQKLVFGILLVMVISLGSCNILNPVTKEEARDAFVVSYAAFTFIGIQYGLSDTLPVGVTVNESEATFTLAEFDVSDLTENKEITYTTMSGTFVLDQGNSTVTIDVTLEGGPVKTLTYSFDTTAEATSEINVVANGDTFTFTQSDFEDTAY